MGDAHIQILGLGVSTIDELLVLERHPIRNEKQKILSRLRQGGGLTGTALVAAARMGCRCGQVIALGDGELSQFLRSEMERHGIRLIEDRGAPDAEPYFSIILTEEGTGERIILWDNSRTCPPRIGAVERELALSAGCLFVDHVFAEAILDVVREARRAGIPVVGDFEREAPGSEELMALTDHIILPVDFARKRYGELECSELAALLAGMPGRSLACVTDGVDGSWYALGSEPGRVYRQPIFPMPQIVDTTGCGDVFHGVYAAGLILGWDARERIRRASAAAALKTQKPGAQAGAPTLTELDMFLAAQ